MSVIPAKFQCDAENCTRTASFEEASLQGWYIVIRSHDPHYVAINKWGNTLPERLNKYHACNWQHALDLQANASTTL